LQAQLLQKPSSIEDVDTLRKLIEDLPSKIAEILEDVKLIHPWYATASERQFASASLVTGDCIAAKLHPKIHSATLPCLRARRKE
jgi:hypothetical protein